MEYGRLHFVLPPLSGVLLREKRPPQQFGREAGILLHPTSLPGAYPIGDLGKEARDFVDFLAAAGQSLWQILPLTEVDDAFSPTAPLRPLRGTPSSSARICWWRTDW